MSLPDKELELLQSASDQLSSNISRISLLRLLVLAALVLAFANAVKQINPQATTLKAIDPKGCEELEVLSPVTSVDAGSFKVDRFQKFFILNKLFKGSESSPFDKGNVIAFDQAAWKKASAILFPDGISDENTNDQIRKAIEQRSAKELPPEIIKQAKEKQQALADTINQHINKNYEDAFRFELGAVGTKTSIDLREWLVFLPFLFLFSEVYLLIQRKKLKLLQVVSLKRFEQIETVAPDSVPTTVRLLLQRGNSTSAFGRHPARFVNTLYLVSLLGLLVVLVFAAHSFLAGLGFGDNILTVMAPVLFTLILATSYAWSYYRGVSIRLEEQLRQQEGISLEELWLFGSVDKLKNVIRRPFRRIPRFWLGMGAGLILITLFMPVSVNVDGAPKSGRELVRKPVTIDTKVLAEVISGETEGAWWPPALLSFTLFEDAIHKNPKLLSFVGLSQRLGGLAYLISLLVAGATLLLVVISFTGAGVLRSRTINVLLSFACAAAYLFMMADFCFYFVSPRLKGAILGVYSVGSLLLFLFSAFSHKRDTSDKWIRLKFRLVNLWTPVAVCSITFLVLIGILLALLSDQTFLDAVVKKNFALAILTLLAGLNLIWLGWRQLGEEDTGEHD
jgi:hypothetical protein